MNTPGTTTDPTTEHADRPVRLVDKAQYSLAGFLVVVGAYVLYDAATLDAGFSDQPVQPYLFPYIVGGALVGLGLLLVVATLRGDVAAAEEGEDIDLAGGSDWRTVALLSAVFLFNIVFIDWLGWAITGAILFAGTAHVLGSRTLIKDVAIGAALSVGTWYGFYSGLGLAIPAGILDGVL